MAEICYFQEKEWGMELILCRSSSISYPPHSHVSVYTAGIVLDGAADLTVNGANVGPGRTGRTSDAGPMNRSGASALCCRRNRVFVIPPYRSHEIKAHGSYSLLTCCVNKEAVSDLPLHTLQRRLSSFIAQAVPRNVISASQSALLSASLHFARDAFPPANGKEPLWELIGMLERFPEQQLTVDDMAQSVHLSKYHFIRLFKERTGLTPHQFLVQNRVRKAQRLLPKPGTITDAALNAGFCDQSHFIRCFEKTVGMTPTSYKAACTAVRLCEPSV